MEEIKEVTVKIIVQSPVEKVWKYWTEPDHIKKWNSPSDDWHTPYTENNIYLP